VTTAGDVPLKGGVCGISVRRAGKHIFKKKLQGFKYIHFKDLLLVLKSTLVHNDVTQNFKSHD